MNEYRIVLVKDWVQWNRSWSWRIERHKLRYERANRTIYPKPKQVGPGWDLERWRVKLTSGYVNYKSPVWDKFDNRWEVLGHEVVIGRTLGARSRYEGNPAGDLIMSLVRYIRRELPSFLAWSYELELDELGERFRMQHKRYLDDLYIRVTDAESTGDYFKTVPYKRLGVSSNRLNGSRELREVRLKAERLKRIVSGVLECVLYGEYEPHAYPKIGSLALKGLSMIDRSEEINI